MSKSSAKQKVEQLQSWISWITAISKRSGKRVGEAKKNSYTSQR